MTKITRPLLRYHGGKFLLAPKIISRFPAHRTYCEPYGGAASVLLRKPRSYAEIYNDLDGEVCNLLRVMRTPVQARELIRQVTLTPYAREEFELSWLTDGDPIEQARRTLFRFAAGFATGAQQDSGTGFRNNATRSGTTPAQDWANLADALEPIAERLRGVVIENKPAFEVINIFDGPNALFYVDPPYMPETRAKRNAGKTYKHEMTDQDHAELAAALHDCAGMVLLSGYACPLYDELYAGWQRVDFATHADGASDRIDSLWIKPNTVVAPTLFDEAVAA